MHFKLTCRDLRGPKIKYQQTVSSPAEKGEERRACRRSVPEARGVREDGSSSRAPRLGLGSWQRAVAAPGDAGEPDGWACQIKDDGYRGWQTWQGRSLQVLLPAHRDCGWSLWLRSIWSLEKRVLNNAAWCGAGAHADWSRSSHRVQSRDLMGLIRPHHCFFPRISRTAVFPFQYSSGLVDAEWKSPNM